MENERIVFTYGVHLDDQRISVSLATTELKPRGDGMRLVFTEQGAYLDGFDDQKCAKMAPPSWAANPPPVEASIRPASWTREQ